MKPSNILIDAKTGEIKLCDFGISGNLINSNAFSRTNTGCAGYMAPERIEPPDPKNPSYDIRADVWSLGITLVELATGDYPYRHCRNEFDVMSTIMRQDAPRISIDDERFTPEFKSFVNACLTKDVRDRPKYNSLLEHPFVLAYRDLDVDVKGWYRSVLGHSGTIIDGNDSISGGGDEDGRSTRSLTPTIPSSQTTSSHST